jgi:hypothetical protein
MSKNILLAVDAASHDPARHVLAAAGSAWWCWGSSSRTDLPLIPLGSVAGRLLHMATRPVLIVPRADAHAEPVQAPAVAATAGADQG